MSTGIAILLSVFVLYCAGVVAWALYEAGFFNG
jgi:hypothetical protein